MEALAIPLLLAVGGLLAVQAGANVQLSAATGSPFGAATIQLGIGAVLLLAATTAAGTLGAFGLLGDAPGWHLIGGLASALYITSGILLFPRLGALLTVGLWITGQMLASLALDGFGWLGIEHAVPGPAQLMGALAVLAGAAVIVRTQDRDALTRAATGRTAWLALAVVAGAGLPLQGAVNAQLRTDLDAPIAAGAVSFVVATAGMGGLMLAALARAGTQRPRLGPLRRLPWWGWLGGLVGATYVTSVFLLIPEIGTAPTIALTVAGQQIASVFVDRYGLLRLPRRPVGPARMAAVGVLLGGVLLVTLA